MTQAEQTEFIRQLTSSIADAMIEKCEAGKVPAHWDGKQLRTWIAETFAEQSWAQKMTRKERRDYDNDIYNNGL